MRLFKRRRGPLAVPPITIMQDRLLAARKRAQRDRRFFRGAAITFAVANFWPTSFEYKAIWMCVFGLLLLQVFPDPESQRLSVLVLRRFRAENQWWRALPLIVTRIAQGMCTAITLSDEAYANERGVMIRGVRGCLPIALTMFASYVLLAWHINHVLELPFLLFCLISIGIWYLLRKWVRLVLPPRSVEVTSTTHLSQILDLIERRGRRHSGTLSLKYTGTDWSNAIQQASQRCDATVIDITELTSNIEHELTIVARYVPPECVTLTWEASATAGNEHALSAEIEARVASLLGATYMSRVAAVPYSTDKGQAPGLNNALNEGLLFATVRALATRCLSDVDSTYIAAPGEQERTPIFQRQGDRARDARLRVLGAATFTLGCVFFVAGCLQQDFVVGSALVAPVFMVAGATMKRRPRLALSLCTAMFLLAVFATFEALRSGELSTLIETRVPADKQSTWGPLLRSFDVLLSTVPASIYMCALLGEVVRHFRRAWTLQMPNSGLSH